ncbi:MAG: sodium/solute symporter [Acidobacteria bacterium]|nr:sodium/solute symporter [Acidobacteriota bacterium]
MDLLIIAAYFVAVFWIGFSQARKQKTSEDYFLAGRHAGWFAVGATLFATNIGSEHVIGLAGSGAATGLPVGCYEWSASFCLLALGWVFVPHYLRSKVFTMPEFLEQRFSPGARYYLTTVSILAYILTKISVSLFAGGILIRELFGWDYMTSAILLVVATGVYTVAGGLSAVIYTDLFQAFVMIGGAILITVLGLEETGGFAGLREALPADYFHMIRPIDDPAYPWLGTTVGTIILGTWYWCTDQVIVQKTLAAKGLADARGGAVFASALKILPVFILVLPGLIAKALWPNETTGDNAFPLLVQNLLPPGLRGLMIAALLAALMSSLSSVFNSCSTLITLDLYKKLRPEASERRLVFIGRANTAIIVGLSIAWIPLIQYMNDQVYQYLQSVQASIGAPITAVFLCGILWRGATARAALTTLIVGGVLGFGRFFLDVAHSAFGVDLGPLLNGVVEYSFLNFSVYVFVFCLGLMVAVSKLGEKPLLAQVERLTVDWTSWRAAEQEMSAAEQRRLSAASATVAVAILALWFHFR